jgi:hypothetical protein
MKGGIVYDGMTLDEAWPAKTPFGVHWWVNPDVLKADAKRITPADGRP